MSRHYARAGVGAMADQLLSSNTHKDCLTLKEGIVTKQCEMKAAAIREAESQLRNLRIPWYEAGRAAEEVTQQYPNAHGNALVNLILTVALRQHVSGMS